MQKLIVSTKTNHSRQCTKIFEKTTIIPTKAGNFELIAKNEKMSKNLTLDHKRPHSLGPEDISQPQDPP